MLTTTSEEIRSNPCGRRSDKLPEELRQVALHPTPRNIVTALLDVPRPLSVDRARGILEGMKSLIDRGCADEEIDSWDWARIKDEIESVYGLIITAKEKPVEAYNDSELQAIFQSLALGAEHGSGLHGMIDRCNSDADAVLADLDAQTDQMAKETAAMRRAATVQVFESEKYAAFLAAALNTTDKEEAARFVRIRSQLTKNGGPSRWLSRLPDDWRDLIDEFEAAFPNLDPFIRFVHRHFALSARGDGRIELPPTLLVGPPGVGKTEGLRWFAERLGIAFKAIDMGSAQTASPLGGSERYWGNTKPGAVFEHIASSKYANPIFLLDEIDKTRAARHDPLSALYQLLEPSSAAHFSDLSVPDLEFDASHVLWVATANDIDRISQPILSRFSVFEIPEPTPDQVAIIARRIYKGMLQGRHWGRAFDDELDPRVANRLTHLPPRSIRKILEQALGAAAIGNRPGIVLGDIDEVMGADRRMSHSMGFLARP